MTTPVVISGDGVLSRVGELLQRHRPHRIFLVPGRASYLQCGAKAILDRELASFDVAHFFDFTPNPQLGEVERGVFELREHDADMVVAVGGGSAIDIAKLINACAASPASCEDLITGKLTPESASLPLIAVPTTAGTGAEMTHFAAVYIGEAKYSMAHASMLPDAVILDPSLTASLPPSVTAATGIDALAQAIESHWSVGATIESQHYAIDAMGLIWNNLERAVTAPNAEVRDAMLSGASLAGQAINISKTTAPHAISYGLTARFGVAHGHAVGLTLGALFEFNGRADLTSVSDPRADDHLLASMKTLCTHLGVASTAAGQQRLHDLMEAIGLETQLRKLGVTRSDLPSLAASVNLERLGNHPRRLRVADIGRILESVY